MELEKGPGIFEFGEFRFDVSRNALIHNGEPVILSPKTLQILRYLLENRGRIIGKEELFERIWPDCYVDETNLTQHIYRIRKALETDAVLIETIPKYGYRFTGEVSEPASVPVFESARLTAPKSNGSGANAFELFQGPRTSAPVRVSPDRSTGPNKQDANRGPVMWVLAALILTFAVGLAFAVFQGSFFGNGKTSVTVLPFKQLGVHPDERLEEGLTDTVLSEIAQNEKLTIVPLETMAGLKELADPHEEPLLVGKELGVDIVVTGTIQTENGLARVNLKFYDVKKSRQYCSAKIDGRYANAFAFQDTIAARTAEKLKYEIERHDKDGHR